MANFSLDSRTNTPSSSVQKLGVGFLRTHALRGYSILLSDALQTLQNRAARRSIADAAALTTEVVTAMLKFPTALGSAPDVLTYTAEFVAELRASSVLEHWARLVLQLAIFDGGHRADIARGMHVLGLCLCGKAAAGSRLLHDSPCLSYLLTSHAVQLCVALDGGTDYGMSTAAGPTEGSSASAVAAALPFSDSAGGLLQQRPGEPVSTVLVQAALMLWGFAVSQRGGELAADPQLASSSQRTTTGDGDDAVGGGAATCTWRLAHLRAQVRAVQRREPMGGGGAGAAAAPEPPDLLHPWVCTASLPPLYTRAAFEISLRLAAAAVAELQRQQGQGAPGATLLNRDSTGGSGSSAGRLRVLPTQAGALAAYALLCAATPIEDFFSAPAVPPWVQQRLERFWRLLLALLKCGHRAHGCDMSGGSGEFWRWSMLERYLSCLQIPEDGAVGLPKSPTPNIAAALAAGYLPAMEWLLRRFEELTRLRRSNSSPWPSSSHDYELVSLGWGQMLVFGPRPAVLSMLGTVAKRQRLASTTGRGLQSLFSEGGWAVELLLSTVPLRWLLQLVGTDAPQAPSAAASAAREAAAAGGSTASASATAAGVPGDDAGYPQLRLAVSFIALCLVWPLLSGLPALASSISPTLLPELLGWLPLLAALRGRRGWVASEGRAWELAAPYLLSMALVQAVVGENRAYGRSLALALHGALRALLHLERSELPEMLLRAEAAAQALLRGSTPAAAEAAAAAVGRSGAAGGKGGQELRTLLRVLGPDGPAPDAELLTSILVVCAESAPAGGGDSRKAGREGAAAGRGAAAEAPAGPAEVVPEELQRWVDVAALLVPPAEVAGMLPGCANPRCTNLAGDGEASLPLPLRYDGGGCTLAYCSRRCRQEHAGGQGHEEQCRASLGATGGAGSHC